MKETTKVSIGGFAFDIDIDAYEVLDAYLSNLKNHFSNRPEGDEIIADVEARMSELFHLKLASSNRVATLEDAEVIINTMGNPRDFDEDAANDTTSTESKKIEESEQPASRFKNKKLYRDIDHKVVAGVCSGLGHFFRIDPVLIRIGFIIVLFLTNLVSHKLNMISVLAYLILWIAMPKANTMKQKISMFGQDPTIEGIENREEKEKVKRMRGEGLSSKFLAFIRISVGALIALNGIVFLSIAVFIIYTFYADDLLLNNLLPQFGFNLKESGFAFMLCGLMPGMMLLYVGIRLFFKMHKRDVVILCVAFVIWLSSALYVGNIVQKEVLQYRKNITVAENVDISITTDTMRIRLDSAYADYTDLFEGMHWYQRDRAKEWFAAPTVVVLTDTTQADFRLSIEKKAYARSLSQARRFAEQSKLEYKVKDASMIILPQFYTNDYKWDRRFYKVIIKVPKGKVVEAEYPIKIFYANDEVDISQLGNPSIEKGFEINLE